MQADMIYGMLEREWRNKSGGQMSKAIENLMEAQKYAMSIRLKSVASPYLLKL